MIGKYNYGTGRRKNAVARVFIKAGKGAITVNDKPVDVFFSRETGRMIVRQPLELTNHLQTFDINVNVFIVWLSRLDCMLSCASIAFCALSRYVSACSATRTKCSATSRK